MTQNAKGPARIAVLPSHRSTNPQKDKEMNSTHSTTGPAAAPVLKSDASKLHALRGLEPEVRELMHMADMAADAFDNLGSSVENNEMYTTRRFTHHELDQFAFLVNNVASRATALMKHFAAANRSGVSQ